MMKRVLVLLIGVSLWPLTPTLVNGASNSIKENIIVLTQIACQFVEIEKNQGFQASSKADCDRINSQTAESRLQKAQVLRLKAGIHVFRVSNKSVPYELGFYLRGVGLVDRLRLPSTSGGGILMGQSRDYEIKLVAGEYVFSCPLNSTPDYRLIVS